MIQPWPALAAILLFSSGCAAPEPAPAIQVSTWGTLREVLREGRSEGRVSPVQVAGPATVGVGALAALEGEITILDGRVLVSRASDPGGPGQAPTQCQLGEAGRDDQAALLVVAEVPAWEEHPLGACETYEQLEDAVAEYLLARGHVLTEPIPMRVRGAASHLELHVIAGACPIADPSGPAPWRHQGAFDPVELVGFFVEGAAGRMTHHTHRSHLHALAGGVMGHLDEVALHEGAVLLLPARTR